MVLLSASIELRLDVFHARFQGVTWLLTGILFGTEAIGFILNCSTASDETHPQTFSGLYQGSSLLMERLRSEQTARIAIFSNVNHFSHWIPYYKWKCIPTGYFFFKPFY